MVSTTGDLPSPPPDEAEAVDPERRTYQPMSTRGPALIVLGIAIFIVVAGVVASALASGGTPDVTIHSLKIPDGAVVHLTPAVTAMGSIVSAGEPPADILGNLAVPSPSKVTRSLNSDQGVSQFDRTVTFTTGLSSDEVVEAFHTLLPRLGWKVTYVGNGASVESGGTEVLAKKASGDSFYWEVGARVTPTDATGTTTYTVELFELPDND
jgi:hypothetical protein